jgi:hypothetical protein
LLLSPGEIVFKVANSSSGLPSFGALSIDFQPVISFASPLFVALSQ